MNSEPKENQLLRDLQERAKELSCLYQIEELLKISNDNLDRIFTGTVKILPSGWRFPEKCQASIIYEDQVYQSPNYVKTKWFQSADIIVQNKIYGKITVSYLEEVSKIKGAPFLAQEFKLINTIAERISQIIQHIHLKKIFRKSRSGTKELMIEGRSDWRVIIDLIQKSESNLYDYISKKMLYYLCWNGIPEAKQILERLGATKSIEDGDDQDYINRPQQKQTLENLQHISEEIFKIAAGVLNSKLILSLIQKWVAEDKSRFLVRAISNPQSTLTDIVDAVTRFQYLSKDGFEVPPSTEKGISVSLIRRFFSGRLDFINVAKTNIDIHDFYDLIQKIIFPQGSRGKLGGKSSGLFLASKIIHKNKEYSQVLKEIKIPKTWYVTSDGQTSFLHYNNLEDILEQKYKEIDEIQVEYPNIIQIFKNSPFPPELEKGLLLALEDFGNHPIIVRSSSLLEDSLGTAFSGKYKSLFLANRGSKKARLEQLKDAIVEIYASTFAPDPIEYRNERGLLDFHEEMGIMIQEVVGRKIGDYFFPNFAGVAFSNNEFRWSARINREDGLIRLVPGLGTRAVDRVSNDYPILIAPGKPNLRVNVTPDEICRYAPQKIDLINLKTNSFETVEISELLSKYGHEIKNIHRMVSIVQEEQIIQPSSVFNINFDKDNLVVTFEGTINKNKFVEQIANLLNVLEKETKNPVDIEFAHDGTNLYLLQCRPQSYSREQQPSPIPKDVEEKNLLFTASRYVSNGTIPNITHIVYVNPDGYKDIQNYQDFKRVGQAVSKLNKILPKRQFILIGPGRWGSRGDIKLGVNVSYSDINNTAMLIEIAKKQGDYIPELSFGTHFFQDLVEASIRYLPLYPDDEGVIFNEPFFRIGENFLSELVPDYSDLSDTIRVIDVVKETGNRVLRVLMNADLNEAVGILAKPINKNEVIFETKKAEAPTSDEFWQWRLYMAEKIANHLDPLRFGVVGFYIFGSTKNATAGPKSDIDILIHFRGTKKQQNELLAWLEGWSLTLSELNCLRTGYKTDGLLDIHWVTDKNIANKESYASKIGAVTDAARPLKMNQPER